MQMIIDNKSANELFVETEEVAQSNIDEYIAVVKELVAQKKYNLAKEFLLIAKEKFNEEARILYNLGIVQIALEKLEEANDYLKKAVEGGYVTYKSLTSYAFTEKALGNSKKELELLRQASELNKEKVLPRIVLANELLEQDKYYEVAGLFNKLQLEYPDDYALYHAEYEALVEVKEYEKACNKLDSINEQFKDQVAYVCDYVLLLHSMGKYDEAWAYFQAHEAILATEQYLYLQLKARVVSALKLKAEAMDCFVQLYEKYDSTIAAFDIAILLLMDKKIKEADEYFAKVIDKNEEHLIAYTAYYMHAKCLALMNADEEVVREAHRTAVDIFEEAYEKDAYGIFTMEYAAECYGYLGDIEKQQICKDRMKQFKEAITNRNKNI